MRGDEEFKKLEVTNRVAFGLVQIGEKGVGGSCQKIDNSCNNCNDERSHEIKVRFFKGDIKSETARMATRAVLKLGGLSTGTSKGYSRRLT